MNKQILNEVRRNRELMGINESELDEQGILRGIRDGIKKGYQKGKEAVKDTFNKIKEKVGDLIDGDDGTEKYNNVPIYTILGQVLDKIDKNKKLYGTVVVNGETLYFGVGESMNTDVAKLKSMNNIKKSVISPKDIDTYTHSDKEGNSMEREVVNSEVKGGIGEIVIEKTTQKTNRQYVHYILTKK